MCREMDRTNAITELWNALAISVREKPSLNSFKGAYLKVVFSHR